MNKKIALFILVFMTLFITGSLPRALLVKKWEEEYLSYFSSDTM
jgi:hypothetical protein